MKYGHLRFEANSSFGGSNPYRRSRPDAILFRVTRQLFEKDGYAVDLLPGRTGGTPDADSSGARSGPPVNQFRDNLVAQQIEWRRVPEEQRLVRCDGVDNAALDGAAMVYSATADIHRVMPMDSLASRPNTCVGFSGTGKVCRPSSAWGRKSRIRQGSIEVGGRHRWPPKLKLRTLLRT